MSERCICCGTKANIDGYVTPYGAWVCIDCVAQGDYQGPLSAEVAADSPFYPLWYPIYRPLRNCCNKTYETEKYKCQGCGEYFEDNMYNDEDGKLYCVDCYVEILKKRNNQ